MEVHPHTHTPRKKWTHYFWEFLMLFLAVFCGFLAEYQLEHKIEKDREKVYMQNMLEDLGSDTAIYADYASRNAVNMIGGYTEGPYKKSRPKSILVKLFPCKNGDSKWKKWLPLKRTYEEMKSSGPFTNNKQTEVSGSISSYYNSF